MRVDSLPQKFGKKICKTIVNGDVMKTLSFWANGLWVLVNLSLVPHDRGVCADGRGKCGNTGDKPSLYALKFAATGVASRFAAWVSTITHPPGAMRPNGT
jgi:hypothetical protein